MTTPEESKSAAGADDVLLILRPLGDPLKATHGIDRDPSYRLKLVLKTLLRTFGFRCVSVQNAPVKSTTPKVGTAPAAGA